MSNIRKLKLIKYNKNLQNQLNIEINDYRIYSRRLIKFEENGIVKEYDYYDDLIYKGEYFKGKRNGKGKEYNCLGNLICHCKY